MNPKERILTIRLLEKLKENPALAEAFAQAKEVSGSNGGTNDAR